MMEGMCSLKAVLWGLCACMYTCSWLVGQQHWFYVLAGFCPHPGIITCTCTSLERESSVHLKALPHWARSFWQTHFLGNFCKRWDHLGSSSKCIWASSKAVSFSLPLDSWWMGIRWSWIADPLWIMPAVENNRGKGELRDGNCSSSENKAKPPQT